ncbi:MAG: hypothetical protein D6721_02500 [Gammaproteobacteria bacterium]|nr:MAG: hypothetical protein D6721_02500 [Gammaproteobacteria bacterium]
MTPRLLCHPQGFDLPADLPTRVLGLLEEMDLLGTAFPVDGEVRYLTGPGFLDHVGFLGCAPDIPLEAPSRPEARARDARLGRFCHWRLTPLYPAPRLRMDPLAAPRCPACTRAVARPRLRPDGQVHCPACGMVSPAPDWRWKQLGACARFFLELLGIHTGEAVPGEALLAGLEGITGCRWGFAYVREAEPLPCDPCG